MFASEFFREVEELCQSGCSDITVDAEGIKISQIKCHGQVISGPETLLILKDLYSPNVYMYARLISLTPSSKEIEILDRDARELGDLRIEEVSLNGKEIVIDARIVDSD